MSGLDEVRFSELFADAFATFGAEWCWWHYVRRGKMAEWEFQFWLSRVRAMVVGK